MVCEKLEKFKIITLFPTNIQYSISFNFFVGLTMAFTASTCYDKGRSCQMELFWTIPLILLMDGRILIWDAPFWIVLHQTQFWLQLRAMRLVCLWLALVNYTHMALDFLSDRRLFDPFYSEKVIILTKAQQMMLFLPGHRDVRFPEQFIEKEASTNGASRPLRLAGTWRWNGYISLSWSGNVYISMQIRASMVRVPRVRQSTIGQKT